MSNGMSASLRKALKKKYGKKLSWADLIILSGTIALQDMGVKIFGFSLGREDIFEADESPDWGAEEEMLTGKERFKKEELERPFAATEMGLIYVNPDQPSLYDFLNLTDEPLNRVKSDDLRPAPESLEAINQAMV